MDRVQKQFCENSTDPQRRGVARLHVLLIHCRMVHLMVLLTGLLVCLGEKNSQASESQVHVFVEADLLHIGVAGTIRSSDMEVYGTDLDVASDFDFDNINTFSGRCGMIVLNRHEFLLGYRKYHFSTTSYFSTDIRFGGVNLSPDVPNTVAMDVSILRLLYGFRLINRKTASLSLRAGIQHIQNDLEIKANLFIFDYDVVNESGESYTPFGLVSGEVEIYPRWSLWGEVSGGVMDQNMEAYVQTMLRYTFNAQIKLEAGYTYHRNKYEAEKDLFETIFSGMLVGVRGIW